MVCVVVVTGAPSIGGAAAVAVVEVLVCCVVVVVAVSGEPPPQPARTRTAPLIHVASRMRAAVVLFDRMMSSGSFRGRVWRRCVGRGASVWHRCNRGGAGGLADRTVFAAIGRLPRLRRIPGRIDAAAGFGRAQRAARRRHDRRPRHRGRL
ncbi:hypothetical protein Acry_3149 (plasmid) [Acidiphilium cryptum JF-5]|uniref:Uncharacterized protein n=1 Tax=Acidiphilium cryptum (strain JF-5) TaxID=349163 RepID=A5FT42_ACICJ|nr:hypothetical protein Acry_3149 [Acidiphilium cryptum JF-5]